MRLFLSGLRKLRGRPASLVTVCLLLGLLVLIIIATATVSQRSSGTQAQRVLVLVTFPAAYDLILSFMFGLGGLFAVIYGAAIAGSEWSWGTLKNAVARGESRSRYMLLSFAAIAVMIAIGLVVTFVVGVGAAIVGAKVAGVSTAGLGDSDTLGGSPRSSRAAGSPSRRKPRSASRSRHWRGASSPASAPASPSTSARPSPRSSCPTS